MSEFEKDLANVMGSFMEVNLDCVEKQNQEIEQLQQENQQLKEKLETYEKTINTNLDLAPEVINLKVENKKLKEEINKMSKKELKVRDMLYSIENGTLTRERLMQIEEVLFELGEKDEQ